MDASLRRVQAMSRSRTMPPKSAGGAPRRSSFQVASPAAGPTQATAELQFTLLPVAHSAHGTITSIAVWNHSIYLGTSQCVLQKLDLEYHEDDSSFFGTLHRSSSALRPVLDSNASFTIVRVNVAATLDAKKHHRIKKDSSSSPIIDLQLCPTLGVIFALSEGVLCAYDLKGLRFQQRIQTPNTTPIDRFALFPGTPTSTQPISQHGFSFMSICLCMGKRLFVLVRPFEETNEGTPESWQVKQELLIPEPAHVVTWIDVAHILVGFRKEYSIINTVTGDVVDLCSIEAMSSSFSNGSTNETMLHRLSDSAILLHTGRKAVVHESNGEVHTLIEAMQYSSAPRAFGSTPLFALILDSTHVHVHIRPSGRGAWRIVQNLSVSNANVLWSDGGSLVLLAKGAQLYYFQPIHVHDRQKDQLIMWTIKTQYIQPSDGPNACVWSRDDAWKALSTHIHQLLTTKTHPFAIIIRAFEHYLRTMIQSAAATTMNAASDGLSSSSFMIPPPSPGVMAGRSTTPPPPTPPPMPTRQTLVEAVRQLQDMVTLHMKVMWADACTIPKSRAPDGDTATPASPPKEDFLSDCMSIFDDYLFRRIYPLLFDFYLTACSCDDSRYVDVTSRHRENLSTPETFGSTLISKSPWMKRQKEEEKEQKKQQQQQQKEQHIDTSDPTNVTLKPTPNMDIPNRSPSNVDLNPLNNGVADVDVPPHGTSSMPSRFSRIPSFSPSPSERTFLPASSSFHPLSHNPIVIQALEHQEEDDDEDETFATSAAPSPTLTSTSNSNSNIVAPVPSSSPKHARRQSAILPNLIHGGPASTLVLSTFLLDAFQPSIGLLRMLPTASSPQGKLKLLSRVHYQLLKDAQSVYDPTNVKAFVMSADELLPIFCYVLIHAKLSHPFAETEFLMDFLSSESSLGVDGYIVTTLQIALSQLIAVGQNGINSSGYSSIDGSPNFGSTTGSETHQHTIPPPSPLLTSLTQSAASYFPQPILVGTPQTPNESTHRRSIVHTPTSTSISASITLTPPTMSPVRGPPTRISSHFTNGIAIRPNSSVSSSPSASSSPPWLVGSLSGGGGGVSVSSSVRDDSGTSPALSRGSSLSFTRGEGIVGPVSVNTSMSLRATGIGSALLAAATGGAAGVANTNPNAAMHTRGLSSGIAVQTTTPIMPTPATATPTPSEWHDQSEDGRSVQCMELRPISTVDQRRSSMGATGGLSSPSSSAAAAASASSRFGAGHMGPATQALLSNAIAVQNIRTTTPPATTTTSNSNGTTSVTNPKA